MRKLLFVVLAILVAGAALPAQSRRFTLDDFSKIARVSDPQFSPDGKSIAVVVSKPNLDEDRYDPELVVVDVATKKSQTIVKGVLALNFERWSPDGTKFAFLGDAPPAAGKANAARVGESNLQIYVVSAKGGAPKAVTSAARGVQQFAWSPDSKNLAFATQDEIEKKQGFERWNRSFEMTLNSDYTMTEGVPPTHLWMVPASGGESKRLTSGAWTMPISHPPGTPASAIVWTPDGSGIVITRNGGGNGGGRATPPTPTPAPGGNAGRNGTAPTPPVPQRGGPSTGSGQGGFGGGLQIVRLNDLSMTPLGGGGNHPQFSPDGKMVVTNNGGLFTIGAPAAPAPAPAPPPTGGTPAAPANGRGAGGGRGGATGPASSLDRGIARALWMPDGKSIIVGANDSDQVSLWLAQLGGGDPKKLDTHGVSPNSSFFVDMSVSKEGAIAFSGTTPLHPSELYMMASATSAPVQMTMVNDELATIPLGKSEVVGWKNDNFEENGIVTYPPDFNPSQKYPLVLYIHGGPQAASMMTWSSQAQLYAAQGWVVFQPNYRGSDNLGRAYQGAVRNDAGEGPGRDVIAGMDELKKKGFVDESRMCVSGWSYGGYMTTWMTGHYPELWKCAVTGASVTNRLDQYNFSDSAGGGGGGSPYLNPQNMDRTMVQSPISMASKVKAPTLILHDTGDYRVAITESFEWFHALRDNGVTTQFIAYPVYGHSPTDPVHQRDVQRRWIEWMHTYLDPTNATSKGGGK
jgi:dipeptidyl aminopeptidase/acylaminoacyl peptidase